MKEKKVFTLTVCNVNSNDMIGLHITGDVYGNQNIRVLTKDGDCKELSETLDALKPEDTFKIVFEKEVKKV